VRFIKCGVLVIQKLSVLRESVVRATFLFTCIPTQHFCCPLVYTIDSKNGLSYLWPQPGV
jgi:hypothetical protein